LNEGKSDLAFTHGSAISQRQGQVALSPDSLILVSTSKDSPVKFDPTYVFVEAGEAFGRDHATAYADADTARTSFGNATTGLEHIKRSGGSAYLPMRIVEDDLTAKTLHQLPNAPTFKRAIFLNYNKAARETWSWLNPILEAEFAT
jgi:hypothetical protein